MARRIQASLKLRRSQKVLIEIFIVNDSIIFPLLDQEKHKKHTEFTAYFRFENVNLVANLSQIFSAYFTLYSLQHDRDV